MIHDRSLALVLEAETLMAPNPTSRDIAREVLRRVRRDDAYANLALSAALDRAHYLRAADRGLATELVYGVLRNRRLLDHVIARHSTRPLGRVDAEVLDVLRVAAYQVLMLDRVPAHAAVNDAVETVRLARGRAVAGFANAVLRKLDKGSMDSGLPQNPIQRMALQCSLPKWLAGHWVDQLGLEEATAMGKSLLQRPPLSVRVNTLKNDREALVRLLTEEGGRAEPGKLGSAALSLAGVASPFTSPSYLNGLWTAQDEGAQLAAELLEPLPGERVLDACCGVGGKSTHLAALTGDKGAVLCIDTSPRKLERLREHCLRLGIQSCEARQGNLLHGATLDGVQVDRVLLDAPCSGLGVIRRHPEQKWRVERHSVNKMATLQKKLLEAVLPALRPGGVLVYSVCTTTDEEGPAQAVWLGLEHPELRPLPVEDGPLTGLADLGLARLWPHRHGTDGFFLARYVKS